MKTIAEIYLLSSYSFDYEAHNHAVRYCSEAREIYNIDEFQEIAKIYLEGKGGVQPDGYKTLEYFSKAAESINYIIDFTKKSIENNSGLKKSGKVFSIAFFVVSDVSTRVYSNKSPKFTVRTRWAFNLMGKSY